MKVYNSKTQKLEDLITLEDNVVKMYVCGPTIYSDIHIGNARPLIFFDVVSRFLKASGYEVKYVSNITDIDDKIINKALELGVTESQLVEENYREYKQVCHELKIDDFYAQPRVTEYIDEIANYIDELVKKNYAYQVGNDVYFDTSKVDDYGSLSKISLDEQITGTRIKENFNKRNPADFTLWKATTSGITFSSPFGDGRPGWHTECVVMINQLLGPKVDIHGGGVDLKFPHHENELAQNKCLHGELANIWMHNGFIQLDNEKMSKSIGNTILVKDIVSQLGSNKVRLLMLQTNYRLPINIDDNFLKQTATIDKKLNTLFQLTKDYKPTYKDNNEISKLNEAMEHDFSTANLITILLSYLKVEPNEDILEAILYGLRILGLEYEYTKEETIPPEIQALIEQRIQYKEQKNFKLADKIREDILALGYDILDTRDGVVCKKVQKK